MADTATNDGLAQSARVSRAGWYALVLVSSAQGAEPARPANPLDPSALDPRRSRHRRCRAGAALRHRLRAVLRAVFAAARTAGRWLDPHQAAVDLHPRLVDLRRALGLCRQLRRARGLAPRRRDRRRRGAAGANSVIFDTFPRSRRGTAMAAMGIATALGLGLSMALGGFVAQWWDAALSQPVAAPLGFSGWQFAFLVAAAPGLLLAWLLYRMREPVRGGVDGIPSAARSASVQGQRGRARLGHPAGQLVLSVAARCRGKAVDGQHHRPRRDPRRSAGS